MVCSAAALAKQSGPARHPLRPPLSGIPVGRTQLLVSRGVGTTELPIRLFAPADVLLLELTTTES